MRYWLVLLFGSLVAGCSSGGDQKNAPPAPSGAPRSSGASLQTATAASAASPPGTARVAASAVLVASVASPDLGPSKWAPPEKPSKPPTVAEWGSAEDIEVRNAKKLNCEVRMVREWLRVSCRTGEHSSTRIKDLRWLQPKTKPGDFFDMVKPGSLASIVFPIRKDTNVRVEFVWEEFTRPLTIRWSPGAPKPVVYFSGDAPMDLSKPNCVAVCGQPYFPGRGTMPCPSSHDPTNGEDNGCICRAYRDKTCATDW